MVMHEVHGAPLVIALVLLSIAGFLLLFYASRSDRYCPFSSWNFSNIYVDEYYLEYQKDPYALKKLLDSGSWPGDWPDVKPISLMPGSGVSTNLYNYRMPIMTQQKDEKDHDASLHCDAI